MVDMLIDHLMGNTRNKHKIEVLSLIQSFQWRYK